MSGETTNGSKDLESCWRREPRWQGIERDYTPADVIRLRPSLKVEYTIAEHGAKRFWDMLHTRPHITSLGAMTGAQAVQMVKAGLEAIYCSGWQVAADANLSGQTYPDQSLYPSNSVPAMVKRINNALMRADLISGCEGSRDKDWYVPIIADAEAGFGGAIHAFELMRGMIEAGAAAVHFEDQLASEKKCGHMGGKVLVPTSQFIRTLVGARLAADVCGVPTVIIARTDSLSATLLTSDIDPIDKQFVTGERTGEGFFRVLCGIESAIQRSLAYAPYADILWFETSKPDLLEAEKFARAIHARYPGKLLAYNCSPSFNWRRNLDEQTIAEFNRTLGEMGYKYQFVTLAGWHLNNLNSFTLAHAFKDEGMPAYVRLQDEEFAREADGYTAVKHQREVGAKYFDEVATLAGGGESATTALSGSTESAQFEGAEPAHNNGAKPKKQEELPVLTQLPGVASLTDAATKSKAANKERSKAS
jgi:isocitrate lyase